MHLPSRIANAATGLQKDAARQLCARLKDISADTVDQVAAEILTATKGHLDSITEVLPLVFDAAVDEPFLSDLYALLCQKMLAQTASSQSGRREAGRGSGDIEQLANIHVFLMI